VSRDGFEAEFVCFGLFFKDSCYNSGLMINHEVTIARISHETPSGDERLASVATITVKPPITPGDNLFKSAIYGEDGHGVSLHHVITTSETTLFLAGSTLDKPQDLSKRKARDIAFSTIKDRIKRLADAPEEAIEMMDENPFPRPLYSESTFCAMKALPHKRL
jgi:hypothetical protein